MITSNPFRFFLLTASLIIITQQITFGQDELRLRYFNEASKALNDAKDSKAEVYAPKIFGRAMKLYTEAADEYMHGKNLQEILPKLQEAINAFTKAIETSKLGSAIFSSTNNARSAAQDAEALTFATELWNKAEKEFQEAGKDVESDEPGKVKENAKIIESMYRNAELEAIKSNYLSSAREMLKEAENLNAKKNAPKTFSKANNLLSTAEAMLSVNRYDTDTARQLAREAEYEASHTLYLHQRITRDHDEEKSFEDLILEAESNISRISSTMGLITRFDEGLNKPVSEAVAALNAHISKSTTIEEKYQQFLDTLHQKESEYFSLRQRNLSQEKQLKSFSENEKQFRHKLTVLEQIGEVLHDMDSLFSGYDINVFSDRNNIIIRFYGLTIPPHETTLDPKYFPLFSIVCRAIVKLPTSYVMVEGFANSQDGNEADQASSEQRAKIVADYLKANVNSQTPIQSIGLGNIYSTVKKGKLVQRVTPKSLEVVIIPNLEASEK